MPFPKRPTTKPLKEEDQQTPLVTTDITIPPVTEPPMVARTNGSNTFIRGLFLSIAVLVIVGGVAWLGMTKGSLTKKQGSQYAVFLSNGQAFFGTLGRMTPDTIELKNTYYIQLIDQKVPGTDGQEQVVKQPQLIRKVDDLYGPTGTVLINRTQMVYMESLRPDSEVLKQMNQ